MTTPCPFGRRRVWPAYSSGRVRCPHCGRRVIVRAGTIRDHGLPAVGAGA